MCGITGVYALKDSGKSYFKHVEKSVKTLELRGPDTQQVLELNNVCLGHSRLAIIDLSNAATQPMQDVTGRYTIVFNGEIYNFKEHREHLIKKGVHLKTHSDTETLLYMFIEEREQCLNRLHGFFAFSVYDKQENSLFVARDRMGLKPLLYYRDEEKFLWASEMKALLALGIPKEIDQLSLNQYFCYNYIPSPNTIFENVFKLSPGCYMKIKGGQVEEKSYYEIPYSSLSGVKDYESSKVRVRELLEASVKERLISDVPLGAFLSGGIDSSVIVAEASKHTQYLNTFSIGYKDEPFFDETHYAELVSKKFKTNHHVFKLSNDDLYANLHQVLDYIDEPFADSSALPIHILSMQTRKYVTVALSGDGADEYFSGYNKHMAHVNAIKKDFRSSLISFGAPLWKCMPKSRSGKVSNTLRQLDRYAHGLQLDPQARYLYWASLMPKSRLERLFTKKISEGALEDRNQKLTKYISKKESVHDILYTDMQMVLVSDMLHKVDSMSMANSLEVRTPFLDFNLVNYVFSLPDEFKVNAKMKKRILQDAYRDILPMELYKRPKHGFEVPLLKWFRNELKDEIEQNYLNDAFIEEQGIFNLEEIKKIKQQLFSSNPQDVHAHIWALVVFQHWWKNYMM